MKSGELAEWLRGAMDRIDPTYNAPGQRADIALAMSDHLPLILAALDYAASVDAHEQSSHDPREAGPYFADALRNRANAREALRRAEED